ncbi:hypothetical protein, partial [Acinetobacter baumannii]|uniref:hypothetical protein n=1 Tax=Acinetobacter baumannii TaxID=470 RepID=UPI00227A2508
MFAYLLNKTRLKLLNKTLPYLLEILEVCTLLLVFLLVYIYISIFVVPFTIKNTFIGRLLFPKAFMNA